MGACLDMNRMKIHPHPYHQCPVSRQALGTHSLERCSKDDYINGFNLIRAFEWYASKGCLLSATLFVTFDVTDIQSIDAMLSATCTSWSDWYSFDQRYHANGSSRIRHQLFCLQGQVLSTDSRCSDGISIYMLGWEQSLVERQQASGELYGRSVLILPCG